MWGIGWDGAISVLAAVAAAMGNATASVMQRKANLEQQPGRRFGPAVLWQVVRSSAWLIGFGGLIASFVLQAVALRLGPLTTVETVITLEVPLTLLVASRVFATRIGRSEWAGTWAMTAGTVVLVTALDPQAGDDTGASRSLYSLVGAGTLGGILLLVLAARRGSTLWRTASLGAAAGAAFGLTATLVKAATARLDRAGVTGLLATWQTYAAAATGLAGIVLVQWALRTGPLLAAQPGFTLMDPLVSAVWGLLVYDESARAGFWLLPAVAGAFAIAAGVLLLARSPLLSEAGETSPRPRPVAQLTAPVVAGPGPSTKRLARVGAAPCVGCHA